MSGRMKKINRDKSRVCKTAGVEFLGYCFAGFGGSIRISDTNVRKFKQRCREKLRRIGGITLEHRLFVLRRYLRGWIDYFVLEHRKSITRELDKWLRRRVRACVWKTWRLPRTRVSRLKQLGIKHQDALGHGCSRKGPWRLAKTSGLQSGLVEPVACQTGFVQSIRTMERACSQEMNRLVRIRMLGGVGGAR